MITLENTDGIKINIDPSTVEGIEDGGPAGCILRIGAARVALSASAELLAELTGISPDRPPEPAPEPEGEPPPAAPGPAPLPEPEPAAPAAPEPEPEPKKSGKKR